MKEKALKVFTENNKLITLFEISISWATMYYAEIRELNGNYIDCTHMYKTKKTAINKAKEIAKKINYEELF